MVGWVGSRWKPGNEALGRARGTGTIGGAHSGIAQSDGSATSADAQGFANDHSTGPSLLASPFTGVSFSLAGIFPNPARGISQHRLEKHLRSFLSVTSPRTLLNPYREVFVGKVMVFFKEQGDDRIPSRYAAANRVWRRLLNEIRRCAVSSQSARRRQARLSRRPMRLRVWSAGISARQALRR